jgi:O-antigen/teichoic acid export membrane protein
MKEARQNISQHSTVMLISFVVASLLNYVFNVSMGWILTPAEYGMLGVFLSLSYILSVFVSSGIPPSIALSLSSSKQTDVKKTIETGIFANIVIGIVLSLLAYLGYHIYYKDGSYYPSMIYLLMIIVLFSAWGWATKGALQGLFIFKSLSIIQVIEPLSKLVFGLALVFIGLGVVGAVLGLVAASILGAVLGMYYVLKYLNKTRSSGGVKGSNVILYTPPLFIGIFGVTLIVNMDLLSVKLLYTLQNVHETIGFYQANQVVGKIPYFIAGVVLNVTFPYISYHAVKPEVMRRYASKTIKYILLFSIPFCILFITMPSEVITFLYPSIYSHGAQSLRIYGIGIVSATITFSMLRILQGSGCLKKPVFVVVGWILFEALLLYMLVPQLGIVGSALSITISSLFGMVGMSILYVKTIEGIHIEMSYILRTIASLSVFMLFLVLIPHTGRLLLLIDISISSVVYLLLLSVFGVIDRQDVDIITSGLGERVSSYALKIFDKVTEIGRP